MYGVRPSVSLSCFQAAKMSFWTGLDGCALACMAGRLSVLTSTFAACALVMKSMYAAATSAFFDFEVIDHGRLSPPSDTGCAPASRRGMRKNPSLSPIALTASAVIQVPAIVNGPLPLVNCCHAGAEAAPVKALVGYAL